MQLNEDILYILGIDISQLGDASTELLICQQNINTQFHQQKTFNVNLQFQISSKQNWSQALILDPEQPLKIGWDVIGMIFIFIQILTVPLLITFSFELEGIEALLVMIMDYYFMVDILIQFQTGYYFNGYLVTHREKIFINYVKTWFLIDLVSSFPYNLVIEQSVDESSNSSELQRNAQILKMLRFVRFIKVIRLVRALKLKKLIDKLEDQLFDRTISGMLQFIKICVIILCLAHWCACIWNALITVEDSNTWFNSYRDSYQVDDTWEQQYLAGLYFSITTMITIGYGDIHPISFNEQIFGIFMMILSSGLFGYVMNMVVALFEGQDEIISEIESQGETLMQYIKQKKAPSKLKNRIKNYLDWLVEQDQIFKSYELNTLNNLSASLVQEVLQLKYFKVVRQIPCFEENFSEKQRSQFASLFIEKNYNPEEFIIKQNDTQDDSSCIYFLRNGKVSICYLQKYLKGFVPIKCRNRNLIHIKTLEKNQYFGEIGFFANIPRSASVQSLSYVSCYELERGKFLQSFQDSRDIEKWYEIKFNIELQYNYENLKLKCYLCQEENHISKYCPLTHYQIGLFERKPIIEKYKQAQFNMQTKEKKKFQTLKRQNELNKSIKKYQSRIDPFFTKIYDVQANVNSNDIFDQMKEFIYFCPQNNLTKISTKFNDKVEKILQEKKNFREHLLKIKQQFNNHFPKRISENSLKRLCQVEERRISTNKQRSSIFNQSSPQLLNQINNDIQRIPLNQNIFQIEQAEIKEEEKNVGSELNDKQKLKQTGQLSTGKQSQSSSLSLKDYQYPDIIVNQQRYRSRSVEIHKKNKLSLNFSTLHLENMIYMVINHKFVNFK